VGRNIMIVFTMLAIFGIANLAAVEARAAGFDGKWDVTLVCPKSPDGALPFTFEFSADVTNSSLHGEYGTPGSPGWMALDGSIQPDGSASLKAHGLTGHSAYNVSNTARGVPYMHPVIAHFEGSQGTGRWAAARVCNFTFTRM
jgi:hypothetical protein